MRRARIVMMMRVMMMRVVMMFVVSMRAGQALRQHKGDNGRYVSDPFLLNVLCLRRHAPPLRNQGRAAQLGDAQIIDFKSSDQIATCYTITFDAARSF